MQHLFVEVLLARYLQSICAWLVLQTSRSEAKPRFDESFISENLLMKYQNSSYLRPLYREIPSSVLEIKLFQPLNSKSYT